MTTGISASLNLISLECRFHGNLVNNSLFSNDFLQDFEMTHGSKEKIKRIMLSDTAQRCIPKGSMNLEMTYFLQTTLANFSTTVAFWLGYKSLNRFFASCNDTRCRFPVNAIVTGANASAMARFRVCNTGTCCS